MYDLGNQGDEIEVAVFTNAKPQFSQSIARLSSTRILQK